MPTAVGKKRGCGIRGFECAMTRARTVAVRFRGPEKLVFPCFSSTARLSPFSLSPSPYTTLKPFRGKPATAQLFPDLGIHS